MPVPPGGGRFYVKGRSLFGRFWIGDGGVDDRLGAGSGGAIGRGPLVEGLRGAENASVVWGKVVIGVDRADLR